MSQKKRGIAAEREVVHMFWKRGWAAIRVAGSGSMKYPCPDILAGNNIRKLAVECKIAKRNTIYIPKKEIEELRVFSETFGAEPWIGVRFAKEEWFFISIYDMSETEGSFSASLKTVRLRGMLLEELIGDFSV
jgi:Holliday junction resolvase